MGEQSARAVRTVALVHVEARKLLLVRPRGKDVYYMPGGKLHDGEDEPQALIREIKEELGVEVVRSSISPYGLFEAQAYGEPLGTKVRMACYTAALIGRPRPSAEIAALGFFSYPTYRAMPEVAPAVCAVMSAMHAEGALD